MIISHIGDKVGVVSGKVDVTIMHGLQETQLGLDVVVR